MHIKFIQIQNGGLAQYITTIIHLKAPNLVDVLVDFFRTNLGIGPSQNHPLVAVAAI